MILVVGHEKLNVEMQRTYGNRMTVVKIPKSGGVCIIYGFLFSPPTRLDAGRRARRAISATRPRPATAHLLLRPDYSASPWAISLDNRRRRFRRTSRAQQLRHPVQRALFPAHRRKSAELPPPPSREVVSQLTYCLSIPESMAPSSALPIGATRTVNEMQPINLDPASPGSGLLNAIVALLALPTHPEETERYDEEVLDLPVSGFLAMFVFRYHLFSSPLPTIKALTWTCPIES